MHFFSVCVCVWGGGGGANIDNMKNTKKITHFCLKMK